MIRATLLAAVACLLLAACDPPMQQHWNYGGTASNYGADLARCAKQDPGRRPANVAIAECLVQAGYYLTP